MKKFQKNFKNILALLCIGIALIACDKTHDFAPFEAAVSPDSAEHKFIHTAVGPMGTNFTVNLFLNDVKNTAVGVTAGLPLGIGIGGIAPASANYSVVPAGTLTARVVIPARNATPTLPAFPETNVVTAPLVLEAAKNHSTFLVGMSPNYSLFTVPDNLTVTNILETRAYLRFFNFITNSPNVGYDLAVVRTRPATPTTPAMTITVKVFPNVMYRTGTGVFESLETIPITENAPDQLQLRMAGTTTVVAQLATGFLPRPGRVYTILARGFVGGLSNGLPSATVNIPVVGFYTNQ